jgi:hypothetical protein
LAELARQLPVFIASPGDVQEERNAVEDEVVWLKRAAGGVGLNPAVMHI